MRLQLALNVTDLDRAVEFYSTMFDTPPAKRRDGYANFAIENPPLKLVLFEVPDVGGTGLHEHLNHLGVETETAAEVVTAEGRLAGGGLVTTGVDDTQCCYAEKTETWVTSPEGVRWEWYVKTGDSEVLENTAVGATSTTGTTPTCCT
jgi:catechol 2,3-dioxygenase-like lactoylglutathione lyase family enzyme